MTTAMRLNAHVSMTTILYIAAVLVTMVAAQDPVVSTKYGQLRGNRRREGGQRWDEFLGVPFATPPVDDLRWTRPTPPQSWNGTIRLAQEYSPHCIQIVSNLYVFLGMGGEDSEDCLYMNIFVPNGVRPGANLPVMLYFFGGAYILGTGEMYPGQDLALHTDTIVINFNYRTGAIGFAGTADDASRGNFALWDGHAALTWIRDNIINFGGDPSRVTLFGQSAGGSSVGLTMLSPHSGPLVHRGISLSGNPSGSSAQSVRDATVALAEFFGCPSEDSSIMMDCLREEEAEDVDLYGLIAPGLVGVPPTFRPHVDGDYLPRHPEELIREGALRNHDWIVGSTFHDSAMLVTGNPLGLNYSMDNFVDTLENLEDFLRIALSGLPDVDAGLNWVLREYPGLDSEVLSVRAPVFSRLLTERQFALSAHRHAVQNSQAIQNQPGSTYLYSYQHRMSFFQYPAWVNASHLDDVYSVFGESFMATFVEDFLEGEWNDADRQAFRNMATYWRNFAHTGNPNNGMPVPARWDQYNTESRMMANLTAYMTRSSVHSESPDLLRRFQFWQQINELPHGQKKNIHQSLDDISLSDLVEALETVLLDEMLIPIEVYELGRDAIMNKVKTSYTRVNLRREINRKNWQ